MKKITLPLLALLFFLVLPIWLGIILIPLKIIAAKKGLVYEAANFSVLNGWQQDNHGEAFSAFMKSCELILKRKASKPMPDAKLAGLNGDWHGVCNAAKIVDVKNTSSARDFFESHFRPIAVSLDGQVQGKFTGYKEQMLRGSTIQSQRYNVPLYSRPPNLIKISLGDFKKSLKGQTITGKVEGNNFIPYDARADIEKGALDAKGLELLWVDDAFDAFSLQIQGSGRVELDDGSIISIGYAGKNGRAYVSAGGVLVKENIMELKDVSMQSIRQWVIDNPAKRDWLLDQNPSFVFFRLLESGDGPFGSAGVSLTAERSLAVDRRFLPLHAPIWLEGSHPDPKRADTHEVPMQRLMIAQDTGGAIKGAVRGDVFWGYGEKANEIAGRMNNSGRLYLLLPHALVERLTGK